MDATIAAEKADQHAQSCRRCSAPIIDPEGNPGLFGEACPAGLKLLVGYAQAIGETVPCWATEQIAYLEEK